MCSVVLYHVPLTRRRLGWPQNQSGFFGEDENLSPCQE